MSDLLLTTADSTVRSLKEGIKATLVGGYLHTTVLHKNDVSDYYTFREEDVARLHRFLGKALKAMEEEGGE